MTTPGQAGQSVPGAQASNSGVLNNLSNQAAATAESEAALAAVIGEAQATDPGGVAATAAAQPAATAADATVVADVAAANP
jgi:hypothetical protein